MRMITAVYLLIYFYRSLEQPVRLVALALPCQLRPNVADDAWALFDYSSTGKSLNYKIDEHMCLPRRTP